MQTFKVVREVRLTDEDIFDMPIGMGTGYWAQSFAINSGGSVGYDVHVINDDEDGFNDYPIFVSNDDIRNAFGRLVANLNLDGKPYHIADYILGYFTQSVRDGEDGGIDVGAIDTDATDVLLQVAIWDEVIYG